MNTFGTHKSLMRFKSTGWSWSSSEDLKIKWKKKISVKSISRNFSWNWFHEKNKVLIQNVFYFYEYILLPILEETWIYLKTRFAPLDVEIKREGNTEISIVDLENVRNVNFDIYVIWFVHEWYIHTWIVSG